jgi:hypothetical protein
MAETSEQAARAIIGPGFDSLNPGARSILMEVPAPTIRSAHAKLLQHGVRPRKAGAFASLLGKKPETIERNAEILEGLGIRGKKLSTNPRLLGMNPCSLQRNILILRRLGITRRKMATNASLLGKKLDTVVKGAQLLERIGLTKAAIANNAQLLLKNLESIRRNYGSLRGLFSRRAICHNAQLLGNSPDTALSSVQFMYDLGVDHEANAARCGTTTQCKRLKIVELARAKFGCSADLPKGERMELLARAREFTRQHPVVLSMSRKAIRRDFSHSA